MGFRVEGVGCRVSGYRVYSLGLGVHKGYFATRLATALRSLMLQGLRVWGFNSVKEECFLGRKNVRLKGVSI